MPYPPLPFTAVPSKSFSPSRALRLVLLVAALLALLLAAFSAAGQLVPAGGPYRFGDGAAPRLLVHPEGGFLALWHGGGGVRGRRFGADGALGAEIDFGPGVFQDVALAGDGTLLFVDSTAVRRHALDGAALGAPVPYDDGYTVPWGERRPYPWSIATVGADDDAGWTVVWVMRFLAHDENAPPPGLFDQLLMRSFDAAGDPLGPTTHVGQLAYLIREPRLAADGAGGWLLTAVSLADQADEFDRGWRLLIPPGQAAAYMATAGGVWNLHAACGPGGHSFTVFTQTGWEWESDDGSCTGVFGLPADAGGDLGPQPVDLPRDTADCQWNARVAALADGWVAGWQTGRPDFWWPGPDGNPFHGVSLRRFDLAGRPLGDPLDLRLVDDPAGDASPYNDMTPLLADLAASGDLVALVWDEGGSVHARLAAVVPDGPCRPGPDHLCLGGPGGDRFRVDAAFLNPHAGGAPGRGRAAPQTADTGAFWFFRPGNLELLVKVLDGRPVNRHHWVLAGAASSVEWWVTVTDTLTREQWGRAVPPHAFATLADVTALPRPPAAGEASAPGVRPPGLPGTAETVTLGGRYRLRVRWRDPRSGDEGVGQGVAVTADSALFRFFHPANLELLVKVLDGRPVNGHAWVLWASLTDVEYEIEVEDTATAHTWSHVNAPYHLGGGADTAALP